MGAMPVPLNWKRACPSIYERTNLPRNHVYSTLKDEGIDEGSMVGPIYKP